MDIYLCYSVGTREIPLSPKDLPTHALAQLIPDTYYQIQPHGTPMSWTSRPMYGVLQRCRDKYDGAFLLLIQARGLSHYKDGRNSRAFQFNGHILSTT